MSEKDVTTSGIPILGFRVNLDHRLMDDATIRGIPIRREEPSEENSTDSLIPIRKEGPEGPYLEWEYLDDRHYTLSSTAFTQRQLYKHEFYRDMYGDLIDYVSWSRERLENERDALIFIAENTTIRVPKVLHFSVENDVASITTAVVDGIPMGELTPMILGEEDHATLVSNVSSYINDTVLPQLNKLTSNTLGTVRGNLLPTPNLEHAHLPQLLTKRECKELGIECSEEEFVPPPKREEYGRKRYPWPSVTSATKDYVYCHNMLQQYNILIDPKTLQVASIIGWEFSGFFLQGFELPYWHESFSERRNSTERGEKNPMIQPLLDLIFGPGEATGAPILQPSPSLTGFSCRVPAWQHIVYQYASSLRNVLSHLLVDSEHGSYRLLESIPSTQGQ